MRDQVEVNAVVDEVLAGPVILGPEAQPKANPRKQAEPEISSGASSSYRKGDADQDLRMDLLGTTQGWSLGELEGLGKIDV